MRVCTVSKSQRSLVTELQLRLATRDYKNTHNHWTDGSMAQLYPVGPKDLLVIHRAKYLGFESNPSKAEQMKQRWMEV